MDHECFLPRQPYLSSHIRLKKGDGWFCGCGKHYLLDEIGPRYHGFETMFWKLKDEDRNGA